VISLLFANFALRRAMIDPANLGELKAAVKDCIEADREVLETLRNEVRQLKGEVRRISPRATTSISLMATDGGENQIRFDPFLIQLVRVVDSNHNQYYLDVVSPTTPIRVLDERHMGSSNLPTTALGKMMSFLEVNSLTELSHMIRPDKQGKLGYSQWINVYRELVEWAVLFSLLEKDFPSDTLIVWDGLLRSKIFAGDLFRKLIDGINARIDGIKKKHGRQIYLVGVAKRSKVLQRYRLAMALEGVLQTSYPAYVEIPREIEEKAYIWVEYARGDDYLIEGGEVNKMVGGKMFLVKFGSHRHDPIWPVDIFIHQVEEAPKILGYLLADAENGFPIPYYPRCLQRAHENAALVDFDLDILQDAIYEALRSALDGKSELLDSFRLWEADPARSRYT
jgi:hypothetical protein